MYIPHKSKPKQVDLRFDMNKNKSGRYNWEKSVLEMRKIYSKGSNLDFIQWYSSKYRCSPEMVERILREDSE